MMKKGILYIVSGPSGAGKGTVCAELMKMRSDTFLSVSATTRAPREGEIDKVHYFFLTKEEFEERINNDMMLEYASFCGNYYGTPREEVAKKLDEGKNVILEIEVQGAMKVKEKFESACLIFILPPSMTELRNRLTLRGTEKEEVIEKRLSRALEEIEYIDKYDYVLINDDLQSAANRLSGILDCEKMRTVRCADAADEFKNS